jgi:tRNA 2-thiouridine synthesizing protein A
MSNLHSVDQTLDCRGLECPLPVLRARAAVADMQEGQRLAVHCTDPHAELDFEAFAARFGHRLDEVIRGQDEWCFVLAIGQEPHR